MRPLLITVIAITIAAGGCGGASGVPAPDFAESRRILEAALGAWKEGKAKDLAALAPPIRLVDPDQSAGKKLIDYRIEGEPVAAGHTVDIPVVLTIRDAKGKTREVKGAYQVATVPDIAVLRNDP